MKINMLCYLLLSLHKIVEIVFDDISGKHIQNRSNQTYMTFR
jgi:hypothetical protein